LSSLLSGLNLSLLSKPATGPLSKPDITIKTMKWSSSFDVYDSLAADSWIENNHDHLLSQSYLQGVESQAGVSFEEYHTPCFEDEEGNTLRMTTPGIAGPVACMLTYNNPALCLFGDPGSDIVLDIARKLAKISPFPVIVRPLSEYPSEVIEAR
jgi:hypothetical protein